MKGALTRNTTRQPATSWTRTAPRSTRWPTAASTRRKTPSWTMTSCTAFWESDLSALAVWPCVCESGVSKCWGLGRAEQGLVPCHHLLLLTALLGQLGTEQPCGDRTGLAPSVLELSPCVFARRACECRGLEEWGLLPSPFCWCLFSWASLELNSLVEVGQVLLPLCWICRPVCL